ncbi:hypothetical protein N7471_001025 [Penicillium samsonianum]|uniref:uncharacterized protein n=1 Tax=Penicillium samsonianum TaxID=1882272 RepID=UPI002547440C|nr:uncharacterized protein N7471_001025 [Penicillium samsonianum]KAJ6149826.1 hypothetical protein N7471_001025 [Penicillium samsonianum]
MHSATAQFYTGCIAPPCYPPGYASYCSVVPNTPLCLSPGNLGGLPFLLDGMEMEWATKNIIISICILIIKYGHRHHLRRRRLDTNILILCNNPIHHHHHHRRRRRRLDTNILILCLLIILCLLLIPFTHNHPENQIVRQLLNLIHAL